VSFVTGSAAVTAGKRGSKVSKFCGVLLLCVAASWLSAAQRQEGVKRWAGNLAGSATIIFATDFLRRKRDV